MPLPALADDGDDSPVAHGVLKNNKLALAFEKPRSTRLPDVTVTGPDGDRPLADLLKGRTILLPIWAEWCAPCLTELPDFARLQSVYGKGKFAIIPVLSGARHKMNPDAIAEMFRVLRCTVFEPLVEKGYGTELVHALARKGNSAALPCNVLIGPDGKVIAREIGIKSTHSEEENANLTRDEAMDRIDKAARGETQSLWGTEAGDEFAVVVSMGFFG